MGNQLAGSEAMTRVSLRAHEDLVDEFDAAVEDGDRWDSRSEALRDLMAGVIDVEDDETDGRMPPVDDDLADAYEVLCQLTRERGWVTEDVALGVLAQQKSMKKQAARRMLVVPLVERGYAKRSTDLTGYTAVKALL